MEYMEMLARLGIGSAHPGGFSATVKQLQEHPLAPGSRVLEVGCGTGRTSCYLAKQGYAVTALDLREDMLAKARRRAEAEGAQVDFVQGSVEALPFANDTFDAVLAESVTIFTDAPKSLAEYARVLRPGGKLYDREIVALQPLSAEVATAIRDFYRVGKLYEAPEWRELLLAAGFAETDVQPPAAFPMSAWDDLLHYPDLQQEIDPDAYANKAVWETVRAYDELMLAYHEWFGFGLMIGYK
jgi:SAM-dependent methyltransferase